MNSSSTVEQNVNYGNVSAGLGGDIQHPETTRATENEQANIESPQNAANSPASNDAPTLSRKRAGSNWDKARKGVTKKIRFEKITATLTGTSPNNKELSLCARCASLELSKEKFKVQDSNDIPRPQQPSQAPSTGQVQEVGKFEIGSGRGKFTLGTLREIWVRRVNCPFCSLVILSIQEQTTEDLAEILESSDELCYASWQLDGREILRTDGEVINRPRTRRIRLDFTGGQFSESYIVLLSEYSWMVDGLFMGRHVRSSATNLNLVQSWIELCLANHGETCKPMPNPNFEELRTKPYFGVIDVKEMRLRELPKDSPYIALSYTWGQSNKFKAVRKNVDQLRKPNGIAAVLNQIPQAIQDAMVLVRNLKYRYLWVDALCIVQDSHTSWNLNSRMMDRVYGNAHLTICAADDPDANAGLVALDSSKRRFSQHIGEYAPGMSLMVSHHSETYIERSRWNTRAWTFQERLLSKRCLIFTQDRVYFQCRSTALSEDVIAEREGAGWSIELVRAPLQMLNDLEDRPLRVYSQCVDLYTRRKLTLPEDVLSAFCGITNLVGSHLPADFIWGLPSSHFDWALLWKPKQLLERREMQPDEGKRSDDAPFPSWSWCGWKGNTHYESSSMTGISTNLHDWLKSHTWIDWHIRDGHGELRQVRRTLPKLKDISPEARKWQGLDPDSPTDHCGKSLRPEGHNSREFLRTLPDFPHNITKADPRAPLLDPTLPDLQLLQFWTWSAYFRLTQEAEPSSFRAEHDLRRFGIADSKGDWCGTIVLDKDWTTSLNAATTYEFLAISDAKDFSREEYDNWNYYIPTERDQSEWDLYYVLLIEKDEGGIASRVGLGKVYKEAFQNSYAPGKDWREFILG